MNDDTPVAVRGKPCPNCGDGRYYLYFEESPSGQDMVLECIGCERQTRLEGAYVESMETEYDPDIVKTEEIPLSLEDEEPPKE